MSGKIRKVLYVGAAGLVVWGVASVAGKDNTLTTLHTVVGGAAWGTGALGGTAPDVVPGAVAGWNASRSFTSSFPAANSSAQPQALTQKAVRIKVPGCSAKQKKAAPSLCA